ncbi:NADPH-dependent FMN reductase [Bdellovibrio sp. BCCA]|uniref:NADPH-dependent FMN reductase n=1 Tax=Bdellovibrio sp. BCCA TaxID=3136281 RepID=UPI0030F106D8
MPVRKVAVIVGSLRKESFNRKMAKVLLGLAPSSLKLEIVEIGDLPLYNQDLDDENRPPEIWQKFRTQIKGYEGVLFVTPEYNRSIPGVLKNAIDVGSRPYGKSVWEGKPAAVVSVSPGAIGGFGANHHLRQCMVFLNMPAMQQPEAYIANAAKVFKDDGSLAQDETRKFLEKFMKSFAEWVELHCEEIRPGHS